MNWIAPDYTEVLEQRLREARLDLMEDPRLTSGQLRDGLDPGFLARLIREKIGAAARYGYDGIESSLRLDAQDALLSQGLSIEAARKRLDDAAATLQPPTPPPYTSEPPGWSPNALAAAAFLAVAVGTLLLYAIFPFHPLLVVCLIALGGIPAVMVRNWRQMNKRGTRGKLLREYPGDLCRHYVRTLKDRVVEYERIVNQSENKARRHASAG